MVGFLTKCLSCLTNLIMNFSEKDSHGHIFNRNVSLTFWLFLCFLLSNEAIIRKSDFPKKVDTQSPSRRSVTKPAVCQTRSTQHHSCPRRRTTGDPLPWWFFPQENHQNTSPHHICQIFSFPCLILK